MVSGHQRPTCSNLPLLRDRPVDGCDGRVHFRRISRLCFGMKLIVRGSCSWCLGDAGALTDVLYGPTALRYRVIHRSGYRAYKYWLFVLHLENRWSDARVGLSLLVRHVAGGDDGGDVGVREWWALYVETRLGAGPVTERASRIRLSWRMRRTRGRRAI